jgi:hypothetical protein
MYLEPGHPKDHNAKIEREAMWAERLERHENQQNKTSSEKVNDEPTCDAPTFKTKYKKRRMLFKFVVAAGTGAATAGAGAAGTLLGGPVGGAACAIAVSSAGAQASAKANKKFDNYLKNKIMKSKGGAAADVTADIIEECSVLEDAPTSASEAIENKDTCCWEWDPDKGDEIIPDEGHANSLPTSKTPKSASPGSRS